MYVNIVWMVFLIMYILTEKFLCKRIKGPLTLGTVMVVQLCLLPYHKNICGKGYTRVINLHLSLSYKI